MPEPYKCPRCGDQLAADVNFCVGCGFTRDTSQEKYGRAVLEAETRVRQARQFNEAASRARFGWRRFFWFLPW